MIPKSIFLHRLDPLFLFVLTTIYSLARVARFHLSGESGRVFFAKIWYFYLFSSLICTELTVDGVRLEAPAFRKARYLHTQLESLPNGTSSLQTHTLPSVPADEGDYCHALEIEGF